MRLLNANTLELEEFFEENVPPYAILSHTWGRDEVLFRDINEQKEYRQKDGFAKIAGCAARAIANGIEWIWVDTCCIDKTSSAELTEAINSMFKWYRESSVCYAYLSDVHEDYGRWNFADKEARRELDYSVMGTPTSEFWCSRWFTRGWTLQELVALDHVLFFNSSWVPLAEKLWTPDREPSLDTLLVAEITGIPVDVLEDSSEVFAKSIACRFSWAAKRQTTRKEDEAYCLMGLFDVNLPLLYGEREWAFRRLQDEIIRRSEDKTLLVWGFKCGLKNLHGGVFARSASDFEHCKALEPLLESSVADEVTDKVFDGRPSTTLLPDEYLEPWIMTARGLRCNLPVVGTPDFPGCAFAILSLLGTYGAQSIALPLVLRGSNTYERPAWAAPFRVAKDTMGTNKLPTSGTTTSCCLDKVVRKTIYIRTMTSPLPSDSLFGSMKLQYGELQHHGFALQHVQPLNVFYHLYTSTVRCYAARCAAVFAFSDRDGNNIYLCKSPGRDSVFGFVMSRPDGSSILDLLGSPKLPDLSTASIANNCQDTVEIGGHRLTCLVRKSNTRLHVRIIEAEEAEQPNPPSSEMDMTAGLPAKEAPIAHEGPSGTLPS